MKKKILALTLVFALALALGIGGTVAWLTATSGEVVNTFTVGDINITLAESVDTDNDGQASFKIVPGGKVAKDPVVTVAATSEKCYVYVKVANTVKLNNVVVATPNIDSAKWIAVATKDDVTLYRYHEIVDAASEAKPLTVFTEVSYADTITKADINTLKETTISIQAFAHQSDNTDQNTADTAAKTQFGLN